MDDLIDFPVSDLWRDHYAAQGMTYAAGRRPRPRIVAPTDTERIEHYERTIAALTAEIVRLKSLLNRQVDPTPFEGAE